MEVLPMKTSKTTKKTSGKAASKTSKTSKKNRRQERPSYPYECKVLRVFDGEYGVLFDVEINHVTLYGCRVCSNGKTGQAFVGFPQVKGKGKNARYWNVAFAWLNDEQQDDILEQVDVLLAEQRQDDEDDEDEDEDDEEDDEDDEPF